MPRNPEVMPRNPEVMPRNPEVMPRNPEVMPRNPELMPRNPEVMPRNPEVMARNSEVMPRNSEAMPRNPEVIPPNPKVIGFEIGQNLRLMPVSARFGQFGQFGQFIGNSLREPSGVLPGPGRKLVEGAARGLAVRPLFPGGRRGRPAGDPGGEFLVLARCPHAASPMVWSSIQDQLSTRNVAGNWLRRVVSYA